MSVNRVDPSTGELSLIAGGTLYADTPVGTIQAYASADTPTGWLTCDGSAVSRTTYAELFAVIGTSFGTGDGSTTFNIPDLRERFLEGARPTSSSLKVGNFLAAGLPNITGNLTYSNTLNNWGSNQPITNYNGALSATNGYSDVATSGAYGASSAYSISFNARNSNSIYGNSNTVQPSAVCVNYIIKAMQVSVPADIEAGIRSLVSVSEMPMDVDPTAAEIDAYPVGAMWLETDD